MKSSQASAPDIKKLGTILSVWAHPDDESYSCAGIMAEAIDNGQTVACVTATRGEKGVQDPDRWPPEQLADIRAAEMQNALAELGVEHHHWLGYKDGECQNVEVDEVVARLRKYIEQYQPQTILTFGPEGMTGHPDHCTVSKWVSLATANTSIQVYHAVQLSSCYEKMKQADDQFDIFFNIDEPPLVTEAECDLLLCLDEQRLEQKYRTLRAMPSQTEAMLTTFDQEVICAMVCCEAFMLADNQAG